MSPTPYEMVREFHEAFGHPVGKKSLWPTQDRVDLRVRLIKEEVDEMMEAVEGQVDFVNFAKELADIIYVVNGFAIEAGIDLDAVVAEVHRSNLSKLGEDGEPIYREDGKVLKGPNYLEADVLSVLNV